jgi:hypothetical protein
MMQFKAAWERFAADDHPRRLQLGRPLPLDRRSGASMVRLIARVVGIGVETADMLVVFAASRCPSQSPATRIS